MLDNINFNHLYYFYIIAREGSIANATKILKVSQPSLSQQLKLFEKSLDASLFDRAGRSLSLNAKGSYLYEYCMKIFNNAELMLTGFYYQNELNQKKSLKIGITSSVGRGFAIDLLKPLFREELMGVETIEGDYEYLVKKLQSFDIDFILTEEPGQSHEHEGIKTVEVRDISYSVIASNKLGKVIERIPEDLDGCNYFKYSAANTVQREIDKLFYKNNVKPIVVGISDDIGLMAAATEVDHCFSIIPNSCAQPLIKEARVKKVGDIGFSFKICGAYIDNDKSQAILEVLKVIKDGSGG